MTKRKDSGMNFDPIDDEATGLSSTMNDSGSTDPHMLPSGLKPKLDLIFSEVEKKLPDIDFDFSDVDSDSEEPVIFHQHLKSLSVEEDKDLDTSQNAESLSNLTTLNLSTAKPTNVNTDRENDNKNTPPTEAPINLYDNDLAYELQQSGFNLSEPEVNSWGAIPVPQNKNHNKSAKDDSSMVSHSASDKPVISWGDIPSDRAEKHVDSNKAKEEGRIEGLSLNSLDDKYIRKQLDREKTRCKEKDLATKIVSPRAPILSTQILENIDLDTLLQNLSTDNQFAPPAPRPAWNTENIYGSGEGRNISANSNSARGDSDGSTLIQKLAQMSMDKYGDDLSDIDPTTGASKSNIPDNDAAVRNRYADSNLGDDVDPASTTIEQPKISQSQLQKMEAALSSRIDGFLDPLLGSRPKPAENRPQGASNKPPVNTPVKKNVSSCGTSTSDFKEYCITPRVPAETNKDQPQIGKGNKEPTVFIDLRNFDQIRQEQEHNIKRVQKVLGIDPTESTRVEVSDSDSDDEEDWREQRKQIKQGTVPGHRASSAPVRSKPPSGSPRPQPPRVINMADLPARLQPCTEEGNQPENQPVQTEAQRQMLIQQKEKEKQQEAVRKLRERREQERQTKLRLQKRLEALKPSASVSGRQDTAEITPIIFDMEASYEPAPHSLPPVLSPDMETLLLTIHLSSNGEIVLHRGSGNKSVDTGRGLSASYTTLLTWLLTLVPDNFTYMQEAPASSDPSPWILPFYVVGLQQALMDDQLCLMVAVTPVEQFDAKYVPVKGKKAKKVDNKGASAFIQHLSKFFSVNTLHSVCPWLQNMVSMEVAPVTEGQEPGYVYKPPLPNITTKPLSTFIQINPDKQAAAKVFNTQVGFFWQTVDSDESRLDQDLHDSGVTYDTQNTISLVYKKIYHDPSAVMGILNRVLQLGLDLAGVRLLYPTPELMNLPKADNSAALSELDLLNNVGGVLALCIRGHAARSIWLDAIGPSDPALARRTDPNSLCALYGGESRDECLLFCPRTPARVQTELVRWFGGRVPAGNVIDVGTPYTKKETLRGGSPKGKRTKKVTFSDASSGDEGANGAEILSDYHRPLATLTATTKSEIFLVFSPLVPPKCFGLLIASCQRRGYQISGIKRCRLSTKKAAALGIAGEGVETFCPGSGSERFSESLADHVVPGESVRHTEALFPSTVMLLQKENACHSAASLIEDGMVQLTLNGIMGTIQSRVRFPIGSQHMIHAGRYSDSLLTALGGDFSKCFDPEIQINPSYVIPQLYTNPELEQITVLLLLGHDILKSSGLFVGKLLNLIPYSKSQQSLPFADGLELLGMKWLPNLTNTQAKEVTPCEVGDRLWKESLHTLTNEPCLVLALRGVNVFKCLEKVVQPRVRTNKQGQPYHYDTLHARNAEEAYTLIRLFFTERELFSDPLSRPLSPYIPTYMTSHLPERKTKQTSSFPMEESIFDIMLAGPRPFTTLLVIKPRAFQKHLTKILKKLNQEGFTIVGLKLQILTEGQATQLIPQNTEEEEKKKHLHYLCSGPSLCMSVQRENAVKKLLDLLGPEDPQSARRLSQFYWRGVFGADTIANGIYASCDYKRSVQDQKLFFPDGLCCNESDITLQEQIECPALDKEMYVKHASIRDVVTQDIPAQGSTSDSHQLLLQTTCLVLPPILMKKLGPHHGYVDVIDGLVSQGFEFVGGRMVWFTPEQAEHFLCLVDAGNFHQVPMLTSGGSIILALQRDNAVVAFDSLLRETFSTESCQGRSVTDSLFHKYGPLILRPADIKQAHSLLGFFFDDLLPSSQVQVLPKLE